jgi:hypothetical protein
MNEWQFNVIQRITISTPDGMFTALNVICVYLVHFCEVHLFSFFVQSKLSYTGDLNAYDLVHTTTMMLFFFSYVCA